MTMPVWSAFALGLLGSLHCAAMCGPLVFALHRGAATAGEKVSYHLGRITTYAMLGALLGLAGWAAHIAGLQKFFSLMLGVVLIASILLPLAVPALGLSKVSGSAAGWLSGRVNGLMRRGIATRTPVRQFYLGLLNGLLPCGMVYVAIAGALAMGHWLQGSLYMVLFGMGTWPMLLAVSFGSSYSAHFSFFNIRKLAPALVVALGLLLIWRGLGLHLELTVPGDPFAGISICRQP